MARKRNKNSRRFDHARIERPSTANQALGVVKALQGVTRSQASVSTTTNEKHKVAASNADAGLNETVTTAGWDSKYQDAKLEVVESKLNEKTTVMITELTSQYTKDFSDVKDKLSSTLNRHTFWTIGITSGVIIAILGYVYSIDKDYESTKSEFINFQAKISDNVKSIKDELSSLVESFKNHSDHSTADKRVESLELRLERLETMKDSPTNVNSPTSDP